VGITVDPGRGAGPVDIWAQLGYIKRRSLMEVPTTTIRVNIFTETMAGPDYDRTFFPPPFLSSHVYDCLLINWSNGHIQFHVDGLLTDQTAFAGWRQPQYANRADFMGETLNIFDRMPGTNGSRCTFTNCMYAVGIGGQFQAVEFLPKDAKSNVPLFFGSVWLSPTSIQIWDRRP